MKRTLLFVFAILLFLGSYAQQNTLRLYKLESGDTTKSKVIDLNKIVAIAVGDQYYFGKVTEIKDAVLKIHVNNDGLQYKESFNETIEVPLSQITRVYKSRVFKGDIYFKKGRPTSRFIFGKLVPVGFIGSIAFNVGKKGAWIAGAFPLYMTYYFLRFSPSTFDIGEEGWSIDY